MEEPGSASQWMNVTQVMRRLGVSRHVLYRLIDAGELPAYRFGG